MFKSKIPPHFHSPRSKFRCNAPHVGLINLNALTSSQYPAILGDILCVGFGWHLKNHFAARTKIKNETSNAPNDLIKSNWHLILSMLTRLVAIFCHRYIVALTLKFPVDSHCVCRMYPRSVRLLMSFDEGTRKKTRQQQPKQQKKHQIQRKCKWTWWYGVENMVHVTVDNPAVSIRQWTVHFPNWKRHIYAAKRW